MTPLATRCPVAGGCRRRPREVGRETSSLGTGRLAPSRANRGTQLSDRFAVADNRQRVLRVRGLLNHTDCDAGAGSVFGVVGETAPDPCRRNCKVNLDDLDWDRPDLDCEPQQARGIPRNLQLDETVGGAGKKCPVRVKVAEFGVSLRGEWGCGR